MRPTTTNYRTARLTVCRGFQVVAIGQLDDEGYLDAWRLETLAGKPADWLKISDADQRRIEYALYRANN